MYQTHQFEYRDCQARLKCTHTSWSCMLFTKVTQHIRKLEVWDEDLEKNILAIINKEKSAIAVISDKIDFRIKSIIRNKKDSLY